MTLHGKLTVSLSRMHFNYETETYSFIGADTNTNKDHEYGYDKMVTFDDTTVKRLQMMNF